MTANNDELRECPFCGSLDGYIERYDYSSCYWQCNGCMARGPLMVIEDEDEEVPGHDPAMKAWNTRANEAKGGEAVAEVPGELTIGDIAFNAWRKAEGRSPRDRWDEAAKSAINAHCADPSRLVDELAARFPLVVVAKHINAALPGIINFVASLSIVDTSPRATAEDVRDAGGWREMDSAPIDKLIMGAWFRSPEYTEVSPVIYLSALGKWMNTDDKSDDEYTKPDMWHPYPSAPKHRAIDQAIAGKRGEGNG